MLKNTLNRSGPLSPLLIFYFSFIFSYLLIRVVLASIYLPNFSEIAGFYWLFPVGARVDTIALCALLLIPTLLLFLLPESWGHRWKPLLSIYFAVATALLLFLEIVTFPFFENFGARPNGLSFQYLDHPAEVFAMLWHQYKFLIVLTVLVIPLLIRLTWNLYSQLLTEYQPWSYRKKLLVFPLIFLLLTIGARSSLGMLPSNPSIANYSNNAFANEMALNSFYTLAFALHVAIEDELDPLKMYGHMSKEEAIKRVKETSHLPESNFGHPELPTLHKQISSHPKEKPMNLVIIVAEGMGAKYVGALGGEPLTPNFDALSEQGIFFSNLYSTGARTIYGLESLTTGFYPTPSNSIIKLGRSQKDFFTIAQLLKQHGYHSEFIYGGDTNFDNMKAFFLNNGFDSIIGKKDFKGEVFDGVWGVSDEDIFHKTNQQLLSHGEQPFVSVVLTLSNHLPFDFPQGRITPVEYPVATERNAINYADHALGEFFERAKKETYYDNTLFLIVADHSLSIDGDELMPVNSYHIPALILGKNIPSKKINLLSSQADLLPTMIDLMGIDAQMPTLGRNLLSLPTNTTGRAMLRNQQKLAYMKGNHVLVHEPNMPAQQFDYRDKKLFPSPIDEELRKEALAHILTPHFLYQEQQYRLP